MAAHLVGQLGQDAAFLVAFGQLQLVPGVVQLHHRQRLHEQRLPGGGLVVDDRADAALEIGAQRDDVAPVALRDDLLLQDGCVFGVVDQAFQPAEQALVRHAHLRTDGRQFGRSRIEHLAAVGDGAGDGFDQAGRGRHARGNFRQAREMLGLALQRAGKLARRDQRALDVEQVLAGQHARTRRDFNLRANVQRAADGRLGANAQQAAGLAGAGLPLDGFIQFIGGAQRARQFGRRAEIGISGQLFQHLAVFKR